MNIDFTQVLKTIEGKDMVDQQTEQIVTLKSIAVNGLMGNIEGENPTGEEKLRRYELARDINTSFVNKDDLTMKTEDVALLKQLIGTMFATMVVGAAFPLLEG